MSLFQDNLFGPKLLGQFDFTLLFEQAMLSVVPGGIAILSVPYYVQLAVRAPPRVRPGALLWLKLGLGLAMLATHAASLVLWRQASIFYSDLSLPAAIMSLVSSLCILLDLYVAHIYSLRTSGFLSIFLTITILFDIIMTRSYFRRAGLDTIGALQIAVIVVKALLVVLEEISKRNLFLAERLRLSVAKETTAGFWNRSIFGWLNSFLIFGFRKSLTLKDLPAIDEDLRSSIQRYDQFTPKWNRASKKSGYALAKALFLAMAWEAAKVILPRLIFVGLTFAQPFLLFSVVHAVNGELDDEKAKSLIFATAIIFLGKAITRALYEHLVYRIMTSARGILVVAIYDKTQRLPIEELEKSAAVTLMTSGTTAVEQMLSLSYEVWSCALQVALGIWSLNLYVGPACYLMLVPGIISYVASHYIGQAMGNARARWNQEMEFRVGATSNVLAQIKGIKSMGLSEMIVGYLQDIRRKEIQISLKERNTRVWLFAFAALTHTLPPTIVLAGAIFWTRKSDPLDVAEVFTVVTIIIIAGEPFRTLLTSLVNWSTGLASLRRIQEFLCLEEVQDTRHFPAALPVPEDHVPGEKEAETPFASRPTPYAVQFDLVAVTSLLKGPILKEVTLRIPWGNLAILWGPIASGKSTLLRSILGETKLEAGVVTVGTKSIAYCNQESWIRNQTLRDNVTGVLGYFEAWYREVIVACGLDVDISAMVNGDQVIAGTGGSNLSGGQKQRVSLARSVYEQTDVIVVDDVFSALDPETARRVFHNLFGREGLVRRWNCTVIMTTNQLEFLDYADVIFRLHKGGRVEQQEVEFSDASSASGTDSDSGDHDTKETCDDNHDEDADDNDEASDNGDGIPSDPILAIEPPSVKPSTNNLELQNAREQRKYGDWSLYGYYLGAAGTTMVVSWICFTAFSATVEQFPNIFIKIWYGEDAKNLNYFFGYVGLSVLNITLNTVVGLVFFHQILPKCSEEMHLRLTKAVMSASHQYLSQNDIGKLLNRFGQDIFLTSQYLPITLMQFLYTLFTVLVEIGIIAAGSIYTAPIMVFLVVVLYLVQFFYLRTSRQLRLLELESAADLFTHFTETGSGVHLVRSFRWQKKFLEQLCLLLDKSQRPYYYLFCCQRWLHSVLDFTAAAAALVLVGVAISRPDGVTSGGLALALLNIIGFNATTSYLVTSWANLETGLGAVSRIKSFCAETPSEQDTLSGPELDALWPTNGRLDFNSVSANYQAEDGSLQKALDNVTFTIFPGEKVGISGRTGSGKSSLLMAILRMADFTGTISIDGRNSRSVPREFLRSRITTMTQDGIELKGSVRFNLYPFIGTKPDEDLVASTLQLVGLLNYIDQHGGLDTAMSSMGFSVSQKQLLFLARGILHQKTMNTSIVIMDEATSAMDNGTDDTLQELLDESFAGCTILQIAHREATFRELDVHVRLEFGQLHSVERAGSR